MSILDQYAAAIVGLEAEIAELETQPRGAHPQYDCASGQLAVRAGATARDMRSALWSNAAARSDGSALADRADAVASRARARMGLA